VWDWAAGRSFYPTAHTISLLPGDCRDWTMQWTPDPGSTSGTYEVTGLSYASELQSGQHSWTTTFTLP
jgi:hypothetical protein